MPWIVVFESDQRLAESIRVGLIEDGWQVAVAGDATAAAEAIERYAPQLVLAGASLSGAGELLRSASRANGGPGAIALGGGEALDAADATLPAEPDDNELRLLVRRLVTAGRAPLAPAPEEGSERLTSQDLFGDLLAEVEAEAPPLQPSRSPAPPRPGLGAAIEQTLSGMLHSDETPKSAAPKRAERGVDDLLSKTLSGLDVGERKKRATPPPRSAPPPAEPRKQELAPAAAPRKGKVAASTSGTPSIDRLLDGVLPDESASAPRRSSKEIDLSALDAFAKPSRGSGREGAGERTPSADPLATQKLSMPSAFRPATGPVEFGQYTLLERIALGGMAEVWKARMKGVEGFQKTVAIKKILPHLTDSSDFVTMFVDEAKLAAQLNHNNIIHIYDLGKIGEDYYIAMEFVDGKDLRSILNAARERERSVPMSLALLVASRLAAALDHAHHQKDFEGHELGLVHRDVSPQNVLISFEGDIKLCDFGIVKAVSKASKTQMGALKGKLQYMSPEQAWGRPVDARSDIFSLGSLLFEMLTARRLFVGESEMSVLDAVREGRISAPRDLDPRIPLEVNALVLHALAREPRDRFGSAGAMQSELEAILASLKPAPTQRDLADYVRDLFAAAPRRESTLATAAAAIETPPAAPAPPPAPASARPSPVAAVLAPGPDATRGGDAALESAPAASRKALWTAVAAAVVVLVAGYLFVARGPKAPATPPPASPSAEAADTATPAPGESQNLPPQVNEKGADAAPEPAAPGDGSPKTAAPADVAKLVDSEVKKREEQLRSELEAELAKKKAEINAAKTAEPAPKPTTSPKPATKPAPAKVAESKGPEKAAPDSAGATAGSAPASAATPPTPESASAGVTPTVAPSQPAPATKTAAALPVAEPSAPAVRAGDLVEMGPGVTPPVLVSVNKPEYPPIARRMRVEGTVVLSLLVDENGRVLDVRLEHGVRENVGINEAAIAAAKSARFRPATKDGVRVKVWHQLTIPFKL